MADVLLRHATLSDGTTVDVRVAGGRIAAVGPVTGAPVDAAAGEAEVHDLAGYLLEPAAVEPHAHLDKAFLADAVTNPTGDLLGAVEAMRRARPQLGRAETLARATRAARVLAANGFGAVRSHADVTVDNGLTSVEALVELRPLVADAIDVEVVAMAGWPITGVAGAPQRALLHAAMAAGADVVGACPHLDDGGTRAATEVVLEIAAGYGAAVDLHTDETLDASVDGLSTLAELVTATGFPHPVTASHCVSLGMQPEARQREVADAVAAAGIAVVALPLTNLYLQGREHQQAMPRGLTAVRALRAAGAVVAAGGDNLQDPFNPLGRGCPLDTAGMMVLTAHLSPADAWATVTGAARRAIGREPVAITTGAPADLLAVRADSLRQAIAMAPADRVVWHRGRRVVGP